MATYDAVCSVQRCPRPRLAHAHHHELCSCCLTRDNQEGRQRDPASGSGTCRAVRVFALRSTPLVPRPSRCTGDGWAHRMGVYGNIQRHCCCGERTSLLAERPMSQKALILHVMLSKKKDTALHAHLFAFLRRFQHMAEGSHELLSGDT